MDNLTLRSAGYFQITRFNIGSLRSKIFYYKSDDATVSVAIRSLFNLFYLLPCYKFCLKIAFNVIKNAALLQYNLFNSE
jgi:hypothetical protein